MADDLLDTRRRVKQRSADIEDRVERGREKGAEKAAGPRPSGVTADQAKKSEHKGSKGERAFGTPIRDRQTTDSNNP